VFQQFHLFPHLSALENVMSGPVYALGRPKAEAEATARKLLERVGLAAKAAARPGNLSGGQQQRVAIARALVNHPAIILADEPTGALDSKTSLSVMSLLQALNRNGQTVLYVTHEADVAAFAKRIITFRDGRLQEDLPGPDRDAAISIRDFA